MKNKRKNRFQETYGIKSKKMNELYKAYSKKYSIYADEGYTRSDKLTKSEFKEYIRKNYVAAQEVGEQFSASKIAKAKYKEQTTLMIDGESIGGKRAKAWYESYVRRFNEAKEKLGDAMYDTHMLSFDEYMVQRKTYKDLGITQNINRQMVTDQSYEYTMTNAMNIKKIAADYGYDEIAEMPIRDIMQGNVDLSFGAGNASFLTELNNALKNAHPDWTGTYRADFIAHSVYGS